jgi:hypothetical protein
MLTLILLLACAPEATHARPDAVEEAVAPTIGPDAVRPARGLWCIDLDLDGWGDGSAIGWGGCTEDEPAYDYAPIGDCNDGKDWISPDAVEVANGVDDDCDGEIDEGLQPV